MTEAMADLVPPSLFTGLKIAAAPNASNGISQDGVDFFNATVMPPIGSWLKQIVLAGRRRLPAVGRI